MYFDLPMGKSSKLHSTDIFVILEKWWQKTLIMCRYLLNLIVLLLFDDTNVVTFPKTENLNVSVTGKFTGSHFETHGFRNIEVVIWIMRTF